MDAFRLNKKVAVVRKQGNEPPSYDYWLSRAPAERITAVEFLRQQYAESKSRLQRVYRVTKAHKVEYLVVGGYAVALHGRPRFTGNIDFWIAISAANASRIRHVPDEFGFTTLPITTTDFQQEGLVIQPGYEPNRIDMSTSVMGLEFNECYARSVNVNLDGLMVNFIHLNDLKINKAATGRGKDIGDLENLP